MLIEDHDHRGRLNDLERKQPIRVDARNAVRKAPRQRIVHVVSLFALLLNCLRPRRQNNIFGFEARRQIEEISLILGLPDPGKVRLAVGRLRRGRGHVRLAVMRVRNAGGRIIQPLRGSGAGSISAAARTLTSQPDA